MSWNISERIEERQRLGAKEIKIWKKKTTKKRKEEVYHLLSQV
jgi:hypothetical protein